MNFPSLRNTSIKNALAKSMALPLTVVAITLFSAAGTPAAAENAVTAQSFPFLIYCEYEGTHHAYYFTRVGPDGRAIYITPDRQAGIITIDGVAERIGGDRAGSCANKTLEELRQSGQTIDPAR